MNEPTTSYSLENDREAVIWYIIHEVYHHLKEKGYNPLSQISGYIMSEVPTYITTHGNACALISKLDRDEILEAMVKWYLESGC